MFRQKLQPYFIYTLLLIATLTQSNHSFAAQIAKVKGKQLLLDLQDDPAQAGDIYYIVDESGKKRGILKIKKVQSDKAIAILGKGSAQPGWMLTLRSPPKTKTATNPKSTPRPRRQQEEELNADKSYWGLILGMNQTTMAVDQVDSNGSATGESVDLKGMGFSGKAMFDYKLFEQLWFRGTSGLEQANATGTRASDSASLNTKILYLSFDLWGRFLFSQEKFRPWLGGGFSMLFPFTKSATAIDEASITNTNLMSIGGGFDYFTSESNYIPFSVEYSMFPDSQRVTATMLSLRLGYVWPF